MKTKRLTELALLATIALTIFMVERQIPNPIPIPGVKLGLANIVTVYAVYRYRPREVFLLVMTRIILGAIFGGNMMALMYSAAGGLLCLAGMIPLHHLIPERTLWICRRSWKRRSRTAKHGSGPAQHWADHGGCFGGWKLRYFDVLSFPAGFRLLCRRLYRAGRPIPCLQKADESSICAIAASRAPGGETLSRNVEGCRCTVQLESSVVQHHNRCYE